MRADFGPQHKIFNPGRFGERITLIGLGGAGSAILWTLLKMGVMEIVGYDPDEVEEHNVPAQLLYSMQHITEDGMRKTDAIKAFMEGHTVDDRQVFRGIPMRIGADDLIEFNGIVISAVDNMESRQSFWRLLHPHEDDIEQNSERYELALDNEARVPLYIDCRMAARIVQLHLVNLEDPANVAAYQSWLFGDEDAAADPDYGARTFIGAPMILAGLVADQLAAHSRGEELWQFAELDLETGTFTVSGKSPRRNA